MRDGELTSQIIDARITGKNGRSSSVWFLPRTNL